MLERADDHLHLRSGAVTDYPIADVRAYLRRALQPDIKFIFVSGYAEDAFARNLPADAKFGFLPKPFSLKQLATLVKEVLES